MTARTAEDVEVEANEDRAWLDLIKERREVRQFIAKPRAHPDNSLAEIRGDHKDWIPVTTTESRAA